VRLLHITDRLSQRGGADWHLLGVLDELVRRGHRVHLAVGRVDHAEPAPRGVELHPLVAGLDAREERPLVDLAPLVERLDPELIHLHNVVNPLALDWAAGLRRPRLMTVQDHRSFCPGRGKWTADGERCGRPGPDVQACAACFDDGSTYFASIHALTAARLRAVRQLPLTVLSHYMKDQLAAAGVPAAQIHVIPPFVHGLDGDGDDAPGDVASGDEHRCVLFAGRLVASKGVAEALEVWRHSGLELPLVFAGTGPERSRLRLDARQGCEVLGWVPHAQLARVYRRAAVLLMPCRWQEPFGIVGLEALSMGVPVAAWDSGGIRDWHPGVGAGLAPWGDVEALACAAREVTGKVVSSPSGFSRAALMERLERVYLDVIDGHHA